MGRQMMKGLSFMMKSTLIYRLNNPVSVTRGKRLNRVTTLIYRSQPIWTRWDYGWFYELFCNLSIKTTLFQTYFLTLRQINSKNYHFHTVYCAQTDKVESTWKLCHRFERWKTMEIFNFVLDLTWSKEVGGKSSCYSWKIAKKFIKSTVISARPNWLRSIDKRGNTIQSLFASNRDWIIQSN